MPLSFNKNTSVEQDYRIAEDATSKYLTQNQIVGRDYAIQTEPFFWATAESSDTTDSFTLTQDIVLTGLYLSATGGNTDDEMRVAAYLNDISVTTNLIADITGKGGTNETGSISIFIPLPNWFLKAGTILIAYYNETGNGWGSCSFIGYLT